MDVELSAEAKEYSLSVRRALQAAGGDDLIKRIEANPQDRASILEPILAGLAAWDLRPRESAVELEAAAALCRSAGYWGIAYPIAERLCRPTDVTAEGLVVVAAGSARAPIADLTGPWVAVSLDGTRYRAVSRAVSAPPRVSKFVVDLDLDAIDDSGADSVPLVLVLQCWSLLGMLDRALDLTRAYVPLRKQFGQPLSTFQSVRFQLADAEVERVGLEALAMYSLWSVQFALPEALDDALALRMVALEAAEAIFRTAHQLHGAFGFCDEATLSWISRNSAPLRQLPIGLSTTRDTLTQRVTRNGLTGLFASHD